MLGPEAQLYKYLQTVHNESFNTSRREVKHGSWRGSISRMAHHSWCLVSRPLQSITCHIKVVLKMAGRRTSKVAPSRPWAEAVAFPIESCNGFAPDP